MFKVDRLNSGEHCFSPTQSFPQMDFSQARIAYQESTSNSQERHAQIGILSPIGTITIEKLRKPEKYGAHRAGSVTKTFTAFLAIKLTQRKSTAKWIRNKM